MKKNFLLVLLAAALSVSGQNRLLDSLRKNYYLPGQPDTQRLKTLDMISFNYAFVNPDSGCILAKRLIGEAANGRFRRIEASGYNTLGVNYMYIDSNDKAIRAFETSYKIAEKLNEKLRMAASQQNIGMVLDRIGSHYEALQHKLKALKLREAVGDKKALANSYANIGISYGNLSDYPRAIEYYLKCQKLAEEQGNKHLLANNSNNIALIYESMDQEDEALVYYQRSIALKEELGLKGSLGNSFANAASVYYRKKNYAKAWELYNKAYDIEKVQANRRGIANSLSNLGAWYYALPAAELRGRGLSDKERYLKSIGYQLQALKISEEIGDKHSVAQAYSFLGACYLNLGLYAKADRILRASLKLSEETQELDKQETCLHHLAQACEKQGKINEAYTFFKRHVQIKDSIYNRDRRDEVSRRQIQYEYDKKATADSVRNAEEQKVKDAEIVAQQAQLKQERTQRFALYGGLLLLLAFGIFAFNRFRVTQKQKHIIEQQKHLVEEKQKEMLDSIHYAKNIQRSLMPTEKYLERVLERMMRD